LRSARRWQRSGNAVVMSPTARGPVDNAAPGAIGRVSRLGGLLNY
jgi:hypothetical protein